MIFMRKLLFTIALLALLSFSAFAQIQPLENQQAQSAEAALNAQLAQLVNQNKQIITHLDEFTTKADLNGQLQNNFSAMESKVRNDLLYYFGLFVMFAVALNLLFYYFVIKRLKKINTGI